MTGYNKVYIRKIDICVFIAVGVKGISRWNKNNNSLRLTVYAMVVSKRIENSYHHSSTKNKVFRISEDLEVEKITLLT